MPPRCSRSTSAVFMPSCAARIAATYPPGPPPTTTRSNEVSAILSLSRTAGEGGAHAPRVRALPGVALTRLAALGTLSRNAGEGQPRRLSHGGIHKHHDRFAPFDPATLTTASSAGLRSAA